MTLLVEVRLQRLTLGFEQRRGVLEKRRGHLVRTGRHRHPNDQIAIGQRVVAIFGRLPASNVPTGNRSRSN